MEKPQQYRILEPHEVIQEGDEFEVKPGKWLKSRVPDFGHYVGDSRLRIKHRRPIPPVAKNATVDSAPDFNTTHDQLLGEVEELKRKLQDQDESSDNSRSYAEIERLTKERDRIANERDGYQQLSQSNLTQANRYFDALALATRELIEVKAENAKLREALEKIAKYIDGGHYGLPTAEAGIAQQALAEKGKG